ncbi:MAG TPA: JAB domain-containing protein [Thermoanaerobaculaceae bacterium]|nr:JAB domain-containing protein [Thermoanaerobaculaceae bacterium]HPS79094.1 JAB domain-containing protein [Thermoanaerobaculaceae bacterium]
MTKRKSSRADAQPEDPRRTFGVALSGELRASETFTWYGVELRLDRHPWDRIEGPGVYLDNPGVAAETFRHLAVLDREMVLVAAKDARHRLVAIHTIAVGSSVNVEVRPRDVFKVAILANADSIMLVHNHPSGDPTPSPNDWKLTWKVRDVAKLMGMELDDHLIVGADRVLSLRTAEGWTGSTLGVSTQVAGSLAWGAWGITHDPSAVGPAQRPRRIQRSRQHP